MSFLTSLTLPVSLVVASPAAGVDQYWHRDFQNYSDSNATDYQNGWRKLAIDDSFNGSATSSIFAGWVIGVDTNFDLCQTVDSGPCLDPTLNYILGESILPVCSETVLENCVIGLSVGNGASLSPATFQRSLDGFTFPANQAKDVPGGGTVSVWTSPDFPHTGGNSYAVSAQINWFRSNGNTSYRDLTIRIAAVQERFSAQSQVTVPYTTVSNVPGANRLQGRAANHNPGKNGCFYTQNQICAYEQEFEPGTRLKLSLKVSNKVTGWLYGRLKDPLVSITDIGNGQSRVEIEAEPVTVPKLHVRWNKADVPDVIDDRIGRGAFGDGNLMAGSTDQDSFGIVQKLRKQTSDIATGQKTYWSLASRLGPQQCVGDSSGVAGIITTNAMVFSGGAPKFENGYLNYEVAGMHFEPGGTGVQLGTYDMLIRSDVARCLYGYSNAPISATVAVVGDGLEQKVASTLVSEQNGWLKLAAYGFTFSEKQVKVAINQARTKNFGKYSGSTRNFSLWQRFELGEFARQTLASKQFVCTVSYLKSTERKLSQQRAETACAYLRSLNPKASFISKTSQVRSKTVANTLTVSSK